MSPEAPTVEAPPRPADEHQLGQAALVSLIPDLLREAWPLLDLHNLQATMPQFTAAVRAIVQRYGQASAAAALTYYQTERRAASVPGRPSLKLAPSPADSVIESAVQQATTNLYGPTTTPSEWQALQQDALDHLGGMVSQLVSDQSRDTIIGAVRSDREAKGWVRVTKPGACSFCIMLALRAGAGMLYTSERSANFRAHTVKADGSGGLCQCQPAPVFTAYEPSAHMREMQKLWKDSTKGKSGNDARNAFRQALEGRPVTGSANKGSKSKPRVAKVSAAVSDAAKLASLRGRLRAFEVDPKRNAIDIANLRKSIAQLTKLKGK